MNTICQTKLNFSQTSIFQFVNPFRQQRTALAEKYLLNIMFNVYYVFVNLVYSNVREL